MVKFGAPLSDDDSDVEEEKFLPRSKFSNKPIPSKALGGRGNRRNVFQVEDSSDSDMQNDDMQQQHADQERNLNYLQRRQLHWDVDKSDGDSSARPQRHKGAKTMNVDPSSSSSMANNDHEDNTREMYGRGRYFLQNHLGLDATRLHLMNQTLFSHKQPLPEVNTAMDDIWNAPNVDDELVYGEDSFAKLDALEDMQDYHHQGNDMANAFAGNSALPSTISPIRPPQSDIMESPAATLLPSPLASTPINNTLSSFPIVGTPSMGEEKQNFESLIQKEETHLPQSVIHTKQTGLNMKYSFRVGWAPNGMFTRIVGGRVFISKIECTPPEQVASEYNKTIERTLEAHKQVQDRLHEGLSDGVILSEKCDVQLNQLSMSVSSSTDQHMIQYCKRISSVWKLVQALWAPKFGDSFSDVHSDNMVDTKGNHPIEQYVRREALSLWLKESCSEDVSREIHAQQVQGNNVNTKTANVLTYLTGYEIHKAVKTAIEAKDFRLALLLAQAGEDISSAQLLCDQIHLWKQSSVWDTFDETHKRIYEVLAGTLDLRSSPLCLDWLRGFGLHFWFGNQSNHSIASIVNEYDQNINATLKDIADTNSYHALPSHLPLSALSRRLSSTTYFDLRYHLIKLFCDDKYQQSNVYIPHSITTSPLDFHLSWVLLDTLRHVNLVPFAKIHHVFMNFVFQLNNNNMFQWAIYVVSKAEIPSFGVIPAPQMDKERVIKELLFQNCPATRCMLGDMIGNRNLFSSSIFRGGDLQECVEDVGSVSLCEQDKRARFEQAERMLLSCTDIPVEWFHEARAIRAKYDRAHFSEAVSLRLAGKWRESHAVLVEYVAPYLVVRDELSLLQDMLLLLEPNNHVIDEWNDQGLLFLQYCQVTLSLQNHSLTLNINTDELNHTAETLIEKLESLSSASAAAASLSVVSSHVCTNTHTFAQSAVGTNKCQRDESTIMQIAVSEMVSKLSNILVQLSDDSSFALPQGLSTLIPENHRLLHLREMYMHFLDV